MTARTLGNAYILALSLAMIFWPASALAQNSLTATATPTTPLNTGAPVQGASSGESLLPGQWVALQFTLTDPTAITDVQGYFTAFGTSGAVNIVIWTNNNSDPTFPVPGQAIWSQSYTLTAPGSTANWVDFPGYLAVLAPGTYWVAFEGAKGSTVNVGMLGPATTPAANSAFFDGGINTWFNMTFGANHSTNYPAAMLSGYDLGTASGSPLITSGTFARTVTQGSLFNSAFSQNLGPVGNIGQADTLQWNIIPGVAAASAYGTISANPKTSQGNILEAGAYSGTGPNGSTGAARGIVFSTYLNTTGKDIPNVQANAALSGLIAGASSNSPVTVSAAVYVFDTAAFTSYINSAVPNQYPTLGYLLLGGDQVVAGQGSYYEPNLGLLFPSYVDDSWDNNSQFEVCNGTNCAQGYEVSTAGFDLPPYALFTVMFDVTAASQGATSAQTTAIGDFLSTLQADPQYFFTDGNPTTQYPYGTPITVIAGPLTVALPATPASIVLSPSTQSTAVGSTTVVTATVTDASNNPVPDAIVRFSITSGTHAGYSVPVGTGDGNNGTTLGVATLNFADTLGTAGMDSISASVGSISAATPAQVTWTTPGPLYTITLTPPTTSISLGKSQTYDVTGSDFFGKSVGDVTSQLTFTIGPDGSCAGATCTPVATGPHTVTGVGSNPVIGAITGTATLTVTGSASSLVITASSPSMIYGGTVPAITASYTYGSVVNSPTPPSGLTGLTCSTTATSSSPVGSYPSNCSGASDTSYTISYAPGSLTVNAAPLTITAASPSMTYGGTVPAVTPLYTYGSLTLSSTAPSGLTPPTCSAPGVSSTSPVGSYSTSCSGASGSNYTISYAPGSLTVNAAALTITAASPSMTYGGTVPAVTPLYTYGSLTLSSTAPSGLTPPTCSAPGVSSTSPVGSYPTSCSGAVDANYTISYAPGSLTVNAAALTITAASPSMTYGGTVPAITALYTYGNLTLTSTPPSGLALPTCLAPGVTSSSPVGTHPTSCSGASDSNYAIGYVAGVLTIVNPTGKTNPVITWPTPAPITYGTPLSSAQLDATANVAGTFAYSPAAKTILTAGLHTLSVTFTPTDTTDYNTVMAMVTLQVNRATPPVVWVPIPITYGTPLGPLQLDALTLVPGTFVYMPPAGTVLHAGNQPLSATFTPNDTTDFLTITVHATLVVLKANQDLDWSQPVPIAVGTPLSATQLDATANVPGTFVYNPPAGFVLPAGTDVLKVTFTPTDTADYQSASAQVSMTVKSKH